MKGKRTNWTVVISKSDEDGVDIEKVNGTHKQIIGYLMKLIRGGKREFDFYEYGTKNPDDLETTEVSGNICSYTGYSVFSNCHVDYMAFLDDGIAVKTL